MWWLLPVALAATEMPYDGIDQDGDGVDLVDVDGDGFASVLAFGPDCNDRDDRVRPDAWDWRVDGIDRNCDGADAPAWMPRERGALGSWALWLIGGISLAARIAFGRAVAAGRASDG